MMRFFLAFTILIFSQQHVFAQTPTKKEMASYLMVKLAMHLPFNINYSSYEAEQRVTFSPDHCTMIMSGIVNKKLNSKYIINLASLNPAKVDIQQIDRLDDDSVTGLKVVTKDELPSIIVHVYSPSGKLINQGKSYQHDIYTGNAVDGREEKIKKALTDLIIACGGREDSY